MENTFKASDNVAILAACCVIYAFNDLNEEDAPEGSYAEIRKFFLQEDWVSLFKDETWISMVNDVLFDLKPNKQINFASQICCLKFYFPAIMNELQENFIKSLSEKTAKEPEIDW